MMPIISNHFFINTKHFVNIPNFFKFLFSFPIIGWILNNLSFFPILHKSSLLLKWRFLFISIYQFLGIQFLTHYTVIFLSLHQYNCSWDNEWYSDSKKILINFLRQFVVS